MAADLIPHEGDLEPDKDYEGMLFDGASFADADAGHCHFLDSSFLNVSFDSSRWGGRSPTSRCARPGS